MASKTVIRSILLDITAPRYPKEFLIDVRFLSWEYNVVVPSPFPSVELRCVNRLLNSMYG